MKFRLRGKFIKVQGALDYLLGPICFAAVLLLLWPLCGYKQAAALAIAVWMGIWWVMRPVNIAVTALLPIPLNACLNLVPMNGIIANYFAEIVVLLLGSDLICMTWETTGLDKRMALRTLCCVGASVKQQIMVWLFASTFLSAVLPNVVVVAIMVPVAVAMLRFLGEEDISRSRLAVPILLAIVWGAGIGGFGSPLGGAANLVAISYIEQLTGREFMYGQWLIRFIPLLLLVMLLNLWILWRLPLSVRRLSGTHDYFQHMYDELGPMSKGEKQGLLLFVLAMVLAFIRPLYADMFPLLKPAYVFFTLGMVTFFLTDENGQELNTWTHAERTVMWGMLFLFAGGLALGKLITETGAANTIAGAITLLPLNGGLETMLVFTAFSAGLSEISSNTGAAAIAVPVVLSTTEHMGLNPVPFLLASIVGFNCAYIFPVSVRAIGVSYGLNPNALLKNGALLAVLTVVMVSIICYGLMLWWPLFSTL